MERIHRPKGGEGIERGTGGVKASRAKRIIESQIACQDAHVHLEILG
jgi:hypothetical protein